VMLLTLVLGMANAEGPPCKFVMGDTGVCANCCFNVKTQAYDTCVPETSSLVCIDAEHSNGAASGGCQLKQVGAGCEKCCYFGGMSGPQCVQVACERYVSKPAGYGQQRQYNQGQQRFQPQLQQPQLQQPQLQQPQLQQPQNKQYLGQESQYIDNTPQTVGQQFVGTPDSRSITPASEPPAETPPFQLPWMTVVFACAAGFAVIYKLNGGWRNSPKKVGYESVDRFDPRPDLIDSKKDTQFGVEESQAQNNAPKL